MGLQWNGIAQRNLGNAYFMQSLMGLSHQEATTGLCCVEVALL